MLVASLSCAIFACDNKTKSDEAQVGEAQEVATAPEAAVTYHIDTTQSTMTWVGSKVTGSHEGNIRIANGDVSMENGKVVGGTIQVDVRTLQAQDKNMDEANNNKLSGHLKSADFFDVEKYPTATFQITKVEEITDGADVSQHTKEVEEGMRGDYSKYRISNPTHRVTGNLTIKDVTKSITFPAQVTMGENEVRAKANFNIDRRDWKLTWGTDRSLGDKMLYSDMNIGFDVVARK